MAAGERVVRVPPQRMGASRKGEREPGKSDEIDALAVARAVVKDGVERFPVAYLNERAMEIRLLLDHRGGLVAERTRTVNRLRWHLLELCPELERSLKRRALNQARVLDRVDRQLRKLPIGARVRIARRQISDLRALNRAIEQLAAELAALVTAHRPQLLAEQGCGALTAAILIGHTAGNERFRSEAAFGLQTGTAPIPCSSGKRTQHRLNRGGDRQLNHALHIIAVTRAQRDPATKQYLARKEAEGKTTKGALRSLKRYLARRFHQLLSEPPADQQAAEPEAIERVANGTHPSCPRSRRLPRRDDRQTRTSTGSRHSRWPASARRPDQDPSAPLSGALPPTVDPSPSTSRTQNRLDPATNRRRRRQRRILSPSASLDKPTETPSTPRWKRSETLDKPRRRHRQPPKTRK